MTNTPPFLPSILLVDDDPDIGIALGDWLQEKGYLIHIVLSGRAAIEALRWHTYQTVILDLGLPDIDGVVVLKRMKTWAPHLPIIILTAFSCFERPTMTVDADEAFAYLKKPYTREEIQSTLDRALAYTLPTLSGYPFESRPTSP